MPLSVETFYLKARHPSDPSGHGRRAPCGIAICFRFRADGTSGGAEVSGPAVVAGDCALVRVAVASPAFISTVDAVVQNLRRDLDDEVFLGDRFGFVLKNFADEGNIAENRHFSMSSKFFHRRGGRRGKWSVRPARGPWSSPSARASGACRCSTPTQATMFETSGSSWSVTWLFSLTCGVMVSKTPVFSFWMFRLAPPPGVPPMLYDWIWYGTTSPTCSWLRGCWGS